MKTDEGEEDATEWNMSYLQWIYWGDLDKMETDDGGWWCYRISDEKSEMGTRKFAVIWKDFRFWTFFK